MMEAKYRCLAHPVVELMGGVGIALIIWFGGTQVLNSHATPGTFMSFLTALIMLYEPVKGVTRINSTIQQGNGKRPRDVRSLWYLASQPFVRRGEGRKKGRRREKEEVQKIRGRRVDLPKE